MYICIAVGNCPLPNHLPHCAEVNFNLMNIRLFPLVIMYIAKYKYRMATYLNYNLYGIKLWPFSARMTIARKDYS